MHNLWVLRFHTDSYHSNNKLDNRYSQEIPASAGVHVRLHVPDLDGLPNPSPCPAWLCPKHTDIGKSGLPQ